MRTLTALTLTSCFLLHTNVFAGQVEFHIDNVKSEQGKIYLQLFNSEQGYQQDDAIQATVIKAKQGTVKITLNDLAPGEYAIRYFHDENDNGKLETNLFGMPTEGYGYSNNAKANFGPATYQDMKFSLNSEQVKNHSSVNY